MTQEEKAKAYNEALERAKKCLDENRDTCFVRPDVIFPELADKDEKIRKEIIDFICWATDRGSITKEQREKSNYWLAWLEKQKTKISEWLFEKGKWYVKLQHHYEGDLRHFEKDHVYQALSEVKITDGYHSVSLGSWEIPKYFRPATKDEIPKETEQTPKLSEDDSIRNYFINAVKEQTNIHQEWKEKCLAWLEKQKPITDEEYEQGKKDVLWCIKQAKKNAKDENEMGTCWFAEKWLEKQGEQKSIDKVEPKFKVGDWVVNDYCMGKVIGLTDDAYLLDSGQGIPFSCEHNAHLWSIQDAKDGDVLASELCGTIMLYKGVRDNNIQFYCDYDFSDIDVPGNRFAINNGQHYGSVDDSDDWYPATKEQRDLLFTKMKESGYEWDAEKKELKKIEPFDKYEGLTDFERTIADICIGWIGEEPGWEQYIKDNADVLLKIAVEKFNSVQDVPFEQKPAWNEVDERILKGIIGFISHSQHYGVSNSEMLNWLKAIKQRIGGE